MKTRLIALTFCLGLLPFGILMFEAANSSEANAAEPQTCVPGPHTGTLTADETWCASDSPHVVNVQFTVAPSATLTIEPGVTVMTDQGLHKDFLIQGHLEALGTPTQPITFTSLADTGPGQWGGLAFDGGTGHLRYATIRYAGDRNSVTDANLGPWARSSIAIRGAMGGEVRLESMVIGDIASSNQDMGVFVEDSSIVVSDTLFTGIGNGTTYIFPDTPLYIAGGDTDVTLAGNTFTANNFNNVVLQAGAMMNHDTSLPHQAGLDGYVLENDFTVPPAVTLTVEPGAALMAANSLVELRVEGRLDALGTPSQPITFTSMADSAPGQWAGIAFDGGTGHLRHATVRYAGERNSITDLGLGPWARANIAMRNVLDGQVRLENVVVSGIASTYQDMGIYAESSHLIVADSLFTGIGNGSYYVFPDTPLYLAGGDSDVALTGNTFAANDSNNVVLQAGAMMSHDLTLPRQEGLDGYVLEQDFTVPPAVTLTVEPGVSVKGGLASGGAELRVEGRLDAIGTASRPITFTSYYDSGPGQWPGLVFEGSGGGGAGHLAHATVRFGGLTNSVLPLPPNHYGSNITVYDVLGGEVRLEHVTVEAENNLRGDHGLYVHNGNVSISASTFEDNCDNDSSDSSGIFATGESQILIDDSVIQANTCSGIVVEGDDAFVRASSTLIAANDGDGVRNKDASTVVLSGDPTGGNAIHDNSGYGASQVAVDGQIIATHNWWGDASGPTHAGNPGGTGEEVTDRVLYDPWLTEAPGPPSPATDLVALLVPPSMSPGETANLGVFLNNVTAMTLQNAVLVFQLPKETEYLYSVPRGEYWRSRHQVIWKLGDLPPGQQFVPAVAVWQHWGVRAETPMESSAAVMAVNLPHPSLDLDTYLAFTGNEVISSHALTAQEIAAALAADPILNAFYQDALDDGLSFYDVALQQTLADGTQALVLVFLDSAALQEGRFVIRAGGDYRVASIVDRTFAFSDQTGGGDFDLDTGDWSFWGSWATDAVRCAESPDDCDPSDWMCYRNCILGNVPGWVLDQLFSAYGLAQSGYACAQCLASGGDACISCSSALVGELTGIGLTGIATDLIKCAADCADDPTSHICDRDKAWCAKQGFAGLLGYNSLRKLDCQEEDCIYAWGTDDRSCGTMTCKECCLYWQSINPDLECEPDPCEEPDNPECDRKDTRVFRASDPNHMSGPGQVTPGQLVTYTISYENVGEGTAYGVYLVSHLPPELDEATLDLAGDGVYFPVSRALLWDVGELAAHAGGSVTFEAQVSTGVVSGTVIMAGATVYFPSVPETTPTNDVVSIVQDVAAFSQELETGEGLPLAITLRGYSPMGTPLAYDVIQDPLNGELSGVSPNLTYTPRDGFEGLDSLSFMVDDGLNASLPAAVTIMVNPGPETIPPEVLATSPDHGASDVPVFVRPQLEDFYLPRLQVRFSEAISETTINTTTLSLLDGQGVPLDFEVAYDSPFRRAWLMLHEGLIWRQSYTATVTTGVHDTSGNSLPAPYTWSFTATAPCFDFDGDEAMGIADIQEVAGHWNMDVTSYPQYDLNGDDVIDVLDIGLVAGEWSEHCP